MYGDRRAGKVLVGAGIGVLITPVAALLAVVSSGAGHGHYTFARLLFPYTMLLTRLAGDSISVALMALALVQFPLYGVLIGLAGSRVLAAFIAVLLLAAHVVAVVFCFSGTIPNFS